MGIDSNVLPLQALLSKYKNIYSATCQHADEFLLNSRCSIATLYLNNVVRSAFTSPYTMWSNAFSLQGYLQRLSELCNEASDNSEEPQRVQENQMINTLVTMRVAYTIHECCIRFLKVAL